MPLPLFPTEELDLTKMDRQSSLSRLQTLAYQANPNWTDFSLSHPENVILEAEATLASMLSQTINERCRQLSGATVTDRLAAIRLFRPYGLTISGATAAQVDGTFNLQNSQLATVQVTLPAGTRISTSESEFQTLSEIEILVGSNASGTVTVENSQTQTETFQSDEVVNIILPFSQTDYIDGSSTVSAGNGTYTSTSSSGAPWRSFLEMGPNDLGYIVLTDNNGRGYLLFGNGIHGAIPQGTISVSYKTGGGEEGRVGPNASWKVLDAVYDDSGNPATVEFSNPAASVGGYNAMTVEEARVLGPLAVRTQARAVNEEDFETAAKTVSGIARAALMTSNHVSSVPEDLAYLYLISYGSPYADSNYYPPAAPTAAQITAVAAAINSISGTYRQLIGVITQVQAAAFFDITVKAKIFKKSNYTAAQVKANIVKALQMFFAVADDKRAANQLIDWSYKFTNSTGTADYKIAWSDVFDIIKNAAGVREVSYISDGMLLNDTRQSVTLGPTEFPRLSTITVYDMDQSGVVI